MGSIASANQAVKSKPRHPRRDGEEKPDRLKLLKANSEQTADLISESGVENALSYRPKGTEV
jgi:hypothetical protein